MKLSPTSQQKSTVASVRTAFTLVELLVVIAIIIVLVSLLMVGVFKALDSAYQAQTRTDITQIAAAVQSFQTKYQVNYIPSRLVLCKESRHYYTIVNGVIQFKSPLHQDSFEYLTRVWPRLGGNPPPGINPWDPGYWYILQPGPPTWYGIDWDNSGSQFMMQRDQLNNRTIAPEVTLEGEQCLVFFLGGIPHTDPTTNPPTFTATGFSTNQSNPAQIGGDRVPPFFEFKSNRLYPLSQWVFNQGGNPFHLTDFYAYLDGYGKTPYAYFSSYKTANGYNRYFAIPPSPYVTTGISDCQNLGVWPYAQSWGTPPVYSNGVYYNAQTYQIISAGKDHIFGPGTSPALLNTWGPSYAGQVYSQGVPGGYDDIANFYDRLLGVPTQ
jgi:type II secretory pathway pseudopilin PulG